MGGAVSGLVGGVSDALGSVGNAVGGVVGGVGDVAGKALQGVANNPVGALTSVATGNYAPLIGSALGGALGTTAPTVGSSFMPSTGGYGANGSMMGPQPIIINNTPGQTQQDQSQGLFSQLLPFLLATGGGLAQGQVNQQAAQTQADALKAAGQQAAQASQFRPVGTTTTFGTSNFQIDPTTGQLTSAGYNLSPQMQAIQDQIMGGNRQSLTDVSNLQNLGRQYIAQSPQEAAQQWMANQQALLAPSRDVESARLANQLQQTGRTGVSVAQGGGLGMANPEQQALANARALQDLQLAAGAQQAGQAQTTFGQNLLTNAYQPFNAGLTAATNVEALGQQPFTMSQNLASNFQRANQTGADYGFKAQNAATEAMLKANQVSPFADIMSALGKTPTATSAIGGALGGLFGNTGNTGTTGATAANNGLGSIFGNLFGGTVYDPNDVGGYGAANVYNPDAFNMSPSYAGGDGTWSM